MSMPVRLRFLVIDVFSQHFPVCSYMKLQHVWWQVHHQVAHSNCWIAVCVTGTAEHLWYVAKVSVFVNSCSDLCTLVPEMPQNCLEMMQSHFQTLSMVRGGTYLKGCRIFTHYFSFPLKMFPCPNIKIICSQTFSQLDNVFLTYVFVPKRFLS
jgi:hypothetical protein